MRPTFVLGHGCAIRSIAVHRLKLGRDVNQQLNTVGGRAEAVFRPIENVRTIVGVRVIVLRAFAR